MIPDRLDGSFQVDSVRLQDTIAGRTLSSLFIYAPLPEGHDTVNEFIPNALSYA